MLLIIQTNGNIESLSYKLETMRKGTYRNMEDWKDTVLHKASLSRLH
jgi:hypothetical protein